MVSDHDRERLVDLEARIRQAEAKPAEDVKSDAASGLTVSRVGFDFIATVAVAGAVGWLMDRELGTAPWLLIVLLLAGFAAGIMGVWRALGGYGQAVGWRKKK